MAMHHERPSSIILDSGSLSVPLHHFRPFSVLFVQFALEDYFAFVLLMILLFRHSLSFLPLSSCAVAAAFLMPYALMPIHSPMLSIPM